MLCSAAGLEVPDAHQGANLLEFFNGSAGPRPDVFACYHGNQLGLFTQRMIRNRTSKYVWNATAEDELYDLVNDPAELVNLAASQKAVELLVAMRRRMVEWMRECVDPVLNQWTEAQLLEGLSIQKDESGL